MLEMDVLSVRLRNGLAFRTRAYNGGIPGPTLSVLPGDTLKITLRNNLQAAISATLPCTPADCTDLNGSTFRHPNSTNLHTHGLHVSSALGADNVLDVNVGPGETYKYRIQIPKNHMAGLFWYHPHLEGSTALQGTGGCAGALIVREPSPRRHGLPPWLAHIPTKTLVLQQLAFAELRGVSLYSGNDTVFRVDNPAGLPSDWADHVTENNQHPDPSSFKTHDHHAGTPSPFDPTQIDNIALVNGQYQPTIHMRAGHWQRWRLLNAGALFFLDLTLPQCEIQLIAIDGVYLQTAPRLIKHIVMTPSGRADVLVRCVKPGRHILASGNSTGAGGEWNSDMYWTPVFANVYVHQYEHEPERGNESEVAPVQQPMEKLGKFAVQRPYYVRDLRQIPQNKTSPFALTFQDVVLVNNDTSPDAQPLFPLNGDDSGTCTFNKMTFKRDSPLLTMALNSVQEWVVNGVQAHPLHIHINPMQIQAFIKDGTVTQAACDEEYGFLCVGDWVDTLQVPAAVESAGAVVRFRVADFKGNDVLHCHYLIHEDQGCLTYARIV